MLAAGSRGELVDSAGESDPTNSPLSTDGGNSATASFRTDVSSEQSTDPAQGTARARSTQVQQAPLGELAILDDSRRSGRSRNGRWRASTNETIKENQRVNKNARERVRVQNVNQEYENLRMSMGAPPLPNDRGRGKKVKKVATLNHAISYVEALRNELEQLGCHVREPPLEHLGPTSGSRASLSDAEVEPKGNGGYNLRSYQRNNNPTPDSSCEPAQHNERATQTQSSMAFSSPNLSCDETFEPDDTELAPEYVVAPSVDPGVTQAYPEEIYLSSDLTAPTGSYFSTIYSHDPPLSAVGALLESSPMPTHSPAGPGEILLSPPTNSGGSSLPLHLYPAPGFLHELPPFPSTTLPLTHEPTLNYHAVQCMTFEDRTPATWVLSPSNLSPPTLTHYPH